MITDQIIANNIRDLVKNVEELSVKVDNTPGFQLIKGNVNIVNIVSEGIEGRHIFQSGTKYSQAMRATYINKQREEKPFVMGCYSIGVSRLAQSAVE